MKNKMPAWDLSDLYKSMDDPQIAKDLEAYRKSAIKFAKTYKGRLHKLSADEFMAAIKDIEKRSKLSGRLGGFAYLNMVTQMKNAAAVAFYQSIEEKMTDYVKPLTEMDADHHAEDEEDEHIWTSLDNAKTLVSKISDEVSKLDQKHKTVYNKNSLDYIEKISKVQSEIENTVNSSKSKKIVVGDRFPLLYFATEFSLDWECAFPGCSTETEPSLDRLSKLTDTIEKDKIKTILKLEMSENKVADTLADETNTKVRTFYSAESVSKEDFANNVTYVDLMKRNNNALKEALSNDTN